MPYERTFRESSCPLCSARGPSGFIVGASRFRPAEQSNLDRFNVNAVVIGRFRAYLDSMDRSNWPELQVKFHVSLPRLHLDAVMRFLKANLSRRSELRTCGGRNNETSPSCVGSQIFGPRLSHGKLLNSRLATSPRDLLLEPGSVLFLLNCRPELRLDRVDPRWPVWYHSLKRLGSSCARKRPPRKATTAVLNCRRTQRNNFVEAVTQQPE